MPIATREQLKDYCLRRLGYPVIEINVDDGQVEDRIQDAIDFWHEYHFDGIEKIYLNSEIEASTLTIVEGTTGSFSYDEEIVGETSGAKTKIWKVKDANTFYVYKTEGTFEDGETVTGQTSAMSATAATDAFVLKNWDSHYLDVSDAVTGIVRVFPIGPSNMAGSPRNIFDIVYQFRLSDMYNLMSTDLIYYSQVKQHLQTLEMLLPAQRSVRFNRKMNKLFLDMNWYEVFTPGYHVVTEAYRILDPEQYVKVYNDIFLKRYATALIKRQWGENLKKFAGIQLPGGVTLNGQIIYDEAIAEIKEIETEMQSRFELPVDFQVG